VRLLGRVFALELATCPLCRRGALRRVLLGWRREEAFILLIRRVPGGAL
jgi:hypothetical protein